MFEMLGLHDDALIQYDELDALFTQFVLNHASGGMTPTHLAYYFYCPFDILWKDVFCLAFYSK